MKKQFVNRLLAVVFLSLTVFSSAVAATPRDIVPLEKSEIPAPKAGQHHYFLACVDNWEGNPNRLGNTDGMIIVTLDTRVKRVLFATVTREMLVKRPDDGIGRLTYVAKNYGPDALMETIGTHFGVQLNKYILFSMDNVQKIIDAMGGVYITVTDAEADYLNRYRINRDSTTPSMAKAGTYLFGGHAAVIYMRIRKVGNEGDAGRTRRMRTVLSTLAQKYDQITLAQAMEILSAVTANTVQTNMTMSDLMTAMGQAMELRGAVPEGIQIPSNEAMESITYAGMSTRQVDFEKAREEYREFLDDNFQVVDE